MAHNKEFSQNLRGLFLVPALPHVLQKSDLNAGYARLKSAYETLSSHLVETGVKRLVFYSTNWIAVLGQLVQAKARLDGVHVDENWYLYGDLPFSLNVDVSFAKKLSAGLKASGRAVQLVDYENFPLDTGTIVAHTLLGGSNFSAGVIANHVYSDFAQTKQIGQILREELEKDKVPTAVVVVSGLSQRFFTERIDLREDRFNDKGDDEWNKRMLTLFEKGEHAQAESLVGQYAQATKADMGFKALALLNGIKKSAELNRKALVHAYAPIYGSGGAVVEF